MGSDFHCSLCTESWHRVDVRLRWRSSDDVDEARSSATACWCNHHWLRHFVVGFLGGPIPWRPCIHDGHEIRFRTRWRLFLFYVGDVLPVESVLGCIDHGPCHCWFRRLTCSPARHGNLDGCLHRHIDGGRESCPGWTPRHWFAVESPHSSVHLSLAIHVGRDRCL